MTASTSSTAPSRASSTSISPTWPTSCRRARGDDMADARNTAANPQVDAVVVGSGAAGALVAAKLAAKGKKVVILESGRSVQNPDMVSSDIYARSLHWGGGMAELEVASPVTIRTYFSSGS